VITDEDADDFKTKTGGAKNAQIIAFVVGIIVGLLQMIAGFIILIQWKQRKNIREEQ